MTDGQDGKDGEEAAENQRWPIGFMLLVGITALYLAWRLIQGVGFLIGRLTG